MKKLDSSAGVFRGTILSAVMFFSLLRLDGVSKVSIEQLRKAAAQGDARSAFFLGDAYFYADRVKKNPVLAVYWYRKAAEKGLAQAQYNLACCLESGSGCRKNIAEAYSWYKKAAEQGFAPASMRLFHCYRTGLKDKDGKVICPPSMEKALPILKKLASQGHKEALLLLASYCMRRNAPPGDHAEAFRILNKLVSDKQTPPPPEAYRMLADCYYGAYGCQKDLKKMLFYLRKACDLSDGEALAKLGFFYEYGQAGLKKDPESATSYYERSARRGHPMGQFKYGEMLWKNADGKTPLLLQAVEYYKKSAAQRCVQAQFKLGVLHLEGLAVPKDLRKAAMFFYEAAKSGYPRAQYNLAQLFQDGRITGKADHEAAFYWFIQAAMRGDINAMHKAADCFLTGQGVERSFVKGVRLLEEAASRGDLPARRKLERLRSADSFAPNLL